MDVENTQFYFHFSAHYIISRNPPVAEDQVNSQRIQTGTHQMNPFIRHSRADAAWHRVGLDSAFPDLSLETDSSRIAPRCKAFHISTANGSSEPSAPVEADIDLPGELKDQVLVFKYKGKIIAIDHVRRTKTNVSSAVLEFELKLS